jgi:hypothetical protein
MATEPTWEIFGAELMGPQEPLRGRLIYSRSDLAFEFEFARERQYLARVADGESSVAIDTLELRISWPSGQLLYPTGYLGGVSGRAGRRVSAPIAAERGVRLKTRGLLDNASVVYALEGTKHWEVAHDPRSGWVRIAEPHLSVEVAATFADNCIAGLARHRLVALWLRPEFIDDLGLSEGTLHVRIRRHGSRNARPGADG